MLLIVGSIVMGGNFMIFIHIPSLIIVFGGAFMATMINFKLGEMIGVAGVLKKAFFSDSTNPVATVEMICEISRTARKGGLLAIEKEVDKIEDVFLKKGLEMVVDGTEPQTIRGIMETEISYLQQRHTSGANIFNQLGMYAPSFGMIGTLIGLIAMLQELSDPSNIGAGMAVALITTFYGALGANMFFLPLTGKLKTRSAEEVVFKEMVIEGVLSIQMGEHPNNIARKLLNFLPPKEREQANTDAK